ncbi:unnamed protein product [Leptidea sinapis]|uniref:Uncharacterized protein n=1 Tax=Leptidea sinapis TaxID=189913 RepID=A0A5E4QKW9_9NEOP|nr:unnamed protein product [Leptidea sinapis]
MLNIGKQLSKLQRAAEAFANCALRFLTAEHTNLQSEILIRIFSLHSHIEAPTRVTGSGRCHNSAYIINLKIETTEFQTPFGLTAALNDDHQAHQVSDKKPQSSSPILFPWAFDFTSALTFSSPPLAVGSANEIPTVISPLRRSLTPRRSRSFERSRSNSRNRY